MHDDLPPVAWTHELEATIETRDRIEDVLTFAGLGPIVLAFGAILAAPFAGVAWRLFTWAAGL